MWTFRLSVRAESSADWAAPETAGFVIGIASIDIGVRIRVGGNITRLHLCPLLSPQHLPLGHGGVELHHHGPEGDG